MNNKEIGKITEVIDTPANEVLRINEKILIPYVKDFIEDINMDEETVYVKEVGGLL